MRVLERPPCPECGMAMITIARSGDGTGSEHRVLECLRCNYVETSQDQVDRARRVKHIA
jgi:DNA-directed RNA polymerase subunit M/transcription elongation factor TFIIS